MLGVRHAAAGAAIALVLAAGATAGAPPSQIQHVTIIGDSVADAMSGNTLALQLLSTGMDVDLELADCRRVDQASCSVNGVRPPNVIALVSMLGSRLGPNVVVAVGYNDFEDQYAANIEHALTALEAAGVKRIWWLTLRAAEHPYLSMNDDIEAAAQKHPELSVIDWNVYSRSHPDWFQPDGLHLTFAGSDAMATLIKNTLETAGVAASPVRITTLTLPVAHRGRPYRAAISLSGGVAPYRWTLLERAPTGIHLLGTGAVVGVARDRPGRYTFNVRVRDASGYTATRRLTLPIRR